MSTITETATFQPGRCAVSGRSEGPFIDTGSDYFGSGRVYLSTLVVKDLAEKHLNLVDGGTVETLIEDLRAAQEEIEELRAFKESVDLVFKKLDRKPPRKRAKKLPADAEQATTPVAPSDPIHITASDDAGSQENV